MALSGRRSMGQRKRLPFGHCLPGIAVISPEQHAACPGSVVSSGGKGEGKTAYCICACHSAQNTDFPDSVKVELPEGYGEIAEAVPAPGEDKLMTEVDLEFPSRDESVTDQVRALIKGLELKYTLLDDGKTVTFVGTNDDVEQLEERYEELVEGDAPTEAMTGVVAPRADAIERLEHAASDVARAASGGFVSKRQTKIPPPIKRGTPAWTMDDGEVAAVGMSVRDRKGNLWKIVATRGANCDAQLLNAGFGPIEDGELQTKTFGYHNLNKASL